MWLVGLRERVVLLVPVGHLALATAHGAVDRMVERTPVVRDAPHHLRRIAEVHLGPVEIAMMRGHGLLHAPVFVEEAFSQRVVDRILRVLAAAFRDDGEGDAIHRVTERFGGRGRGGRGDRRRARRWSFDHDAGRCGLDQRLAQIGGFHDDVVLGEQREDRDEQDGDQRGERTSETLRIGFATMLR